MGRLAWSRLFVGAFLQFEKYLRKYLRRQPPHLLPFPPPPPPPPPVKIAARAGRSGRCRRHQPSATRPPPVARRQPPATSRPSPVARRPSPAASRHPAAARHGRPMKTQRSVGQFFSVNALPSARETAYHLTRLSLRENPASFKVFFFVCFVFVLRTRAHYSKRTC